MYISIDQIIQYYIVLVLWTIVLLPLLVMGVVLNEIISHLIIFISLHRNCWIGKVSCSSNLQVSYRSLWDGWQKDTRFKKSQYQGAFYYIPLTLRNVIRVPFLRASNWIRSIAWDYYKGVPSLKPKVNNFVELTFLRDIHRGQDHICWSQISLKTCWKF